MNDAQKELCTAVGRLLCNNENCKSDNLQAEISFDGISDLSYTFHIVCRDCGSMSPVAKLKSDHSSVVEVKEEINGRRYIKEIVKVR